MSAHSFGTSAARRRAAGADPGSARAELRRLRCAQGLVAAAPRRPVSRVLHRRTADGKGRVEGRNPGQEASNHDPDGQAERARDLLERDFSASAPNCLWVSDFTHVATWSGVVYVAFAIDAFSRRIVGWKADTTMKTSLVLDTLEMALWAREYHGESVAEGLVLDGDAGSQFTSLPSLNDSSTPAPILDRIRRRWV
jgi:transposase InsO family protein